MCGICGIINFGDDAVEVSLIRKMMTVLKHRGPDDEGVFTVGNTGLGFVRLSILDLTDAGHQPMISGDGRYVIVYNGEIFNYIELRADLIKRGYQFRTRTDTEVLLAAYTEWGVQCLERFNGMWAFVIYDNVTRTCFASRDRYGIKPFYYVLEENRFIFSSEISALLNVLKCKPGINEEAVFDYLVFNRTDHNENTFYSGIRRLPHGCNATITDIGLTISRWYRLKDQLDESKAYAGPEEFLSLMTDSVGLRLRSDVPLGVCLSGGLDSSGIVSLLTGSFGLSEINTFSAIYEKGQKGDESEFIKEYQGIVRNMHFTTPDATSLYEDLEDFVRIHTEPVPDTGVYAQYKVMQLAGEHAAVTLDGQGADEIMAGYHYFFGVYFKELVRRARLVKLASEVLYYLSRHRSLYGLKTMAYFMLPEALKTRTRVYEKGYLRNDFFMRNMNKSILSRDLYASHSLSDSLLDHFEYKLEHLLKWEDLNSMRFSVEARVPFLDHRLVERTLSSSSEMIINKGMTKSILRESMKGIIPEKIRTRKDKIGFGTPQDDWFRSPQLDKIITDVISPESHLTRKYIKPEVASGIFNQYRKGNLNMTKEIWKWISLEMWHRMINS